MIRSTVVARLVELVLVLVAFLAVTYPDTSAAEVSPGQRVVVAAGVSFFSDYYETRSAGVTRIEAIWTVEEVWEEWGRLTRRSPGMYERIIVRLTEMRRLSDGPPRPGRSPKRVVANKAECTTKGRCNFAIRAGKQFDQHFPIAYRYIELQKRTEFSRPVEVCRVGPLFRLRPDSTDTEWLAPATIAIRPRREFMWEHEDSIEILAEGKRAVPPECTQRTNNPNEIVLGGTSAPPQFGIFLLTESAAAKAQDARSKSLETGYRVAEKLATKSWAGPRTFCEDAVRQTIGMISLGRMLKNDWRRTWKRATMADVEQRHWKEILIRHANMFERYQPDRCRATLETYVEALRYAAGHPDLEIVNHGY